MSYQCEGQIRAVEKCSAMTGKGFNERTKSAEINFCKNVEIERQQDAGVIRQEK